jgi:protein involved in temperature-dependent protein secretion
MQRWYMLGLYLGYTAVYTPAQNWVGSMGRSKYLQAIYGACPQSDDSTLLSTCTGWYNQYKSFYTPFSQQVVEEAL